MSNQEFDDLILAFAEDAAEHLGVFESVLLQLDDVVDDGDVVDAKVLDPTLRPLHTIKGNAGMLGFSAFSAAVHAIEEAVKNAIKAGKLGRVQLDLYFGCLVHLRAGLRDISDTLNEPTTLADDVEAMLAQGDVDATAGSSERTIDVGDLTITTRSSDTLRIKSSRLDDLLSDLGELGIYLSGLRSSIQTQIAHVNRDQAYQLQGLFDRVDRSFENAQSLAVNLRMVPLDTLFSQVPGWVRDLGTSLNKKVQAQVEGSDILLDKNIVDGLHEPFIHLVRNAIDHGLEFEDERRLLDKDLRGQLMVIATSEAGRLTINITDDGRGLDQEKILAKARESGLIKEGESTENWMDLIFEPGFSTQQDVSEISGRGVGMDIVRSSIAKLEGTVRVSSMRGQGTTFSIELPVTLAVTDLLKIRSGKNLYGIAMRDIVETSAIDVSNIETVDKYSFYRLDSDSVVPMWDARTMGKARSDHRFDEKYIVILERAGKRAVLVCDSLVGEDRAVLRPLLDPLFNNGLLRSASIEGDGAVSYVVDVASIVGSGGV